MDPGVCVCVCVLAVFSIALEREEPGARESLLLGISLLVGRRAAGALSNHLSFPFKWGGGFALSWPAGPPGTPKDASRIPRAGEGIGSPEARLAQGKGGGSHSVHAPREQTGCQIWAVGGGESGGREVPQDGGLMLQAPSLLQCGPQRPEEDGLL